MGQKWRACPYLGMRFLTITLPFSGSWVEIFVGAQKTTMYRLVIRNQDDVAKPV